MDQVPKKAEKPEKPYTKKPKLTEGSVHGLYDTYQCDGISMGLSGFRPFWTSTVYSDIQKSNMALIVLNVSLLTNSTM